jgi:ribosomal protein S18 acetylase RimI-like enzyme
MAIALLPSTELPRAELAELFTASYEGYFVPFKVDEQALAFMVDAFDLDLAESLVAVEDGTPVGLANLGRRGERTWVGGVGVVPARRGAGIGEQLMRGLFDRARGVGAREMVLEVIVENAPAIALYEKLGFVSTRELEVLSVAEETGGAAGDASVEVARGLIAARRDGPEPWQRDDATVANLTAGEPPPRALISGDAAAIYRMSGPSISLLQAAGGSEGLGALVAALRAKGAVSAVNYPAGGPVAVVLREAGAEVVLRQYEMTVAL